MPQWTFKCNDCGRLEDRWFATFDEMHAFEQVHHSCKPNPKTGRCVGKMVRQVSAPAFKIEGYSYANGYSKDK